MTKGYAEAKAGSVSNCTRIGQTRLAANAMMHLVARNRKTDDGRAGTKLERSHVHS